MSAALPPLERAAWEALLNRIHLDLVDPENESEAERLDNQLEDVITALLAAEPDADAFVGPDPDVCICGEINARHCPVHNEPPAAPAPYGATGEPDLLCFNCGRKWEDGHVCYPAATAPDAELERLLEAASVPQGWAVGEPLTDAQFQWVHRVRRACIAVSNSIALTRRAE